MAIKNYKDLNIWQIGRKRLFTTLWILSYTIISCGDISTNDQRLTTNNTGSIKALVTNSRSFNPNISHGQILQYRVTITAPDLAEPITAVFDGTLQEGTIENVPAGTLRRLIIEAINANDKKIKEGEANDLEIRPAETTEADIVLDSVPTFANLAEGNVIPNTRFIAKVFADAKITIEDEFNGVTLPLLDISSGSAELTPDTESSLAIFTPPLLAVGEHTFTVKDTATGRSNSVTVKITDGSQLKAAPLFSASSNQPAWIK